jgi:hypothetical protein
MMTNFGCTELQGFYFSKALAAEEMAELLSTFEPQRFTQAPRSLHVVTTRGANG